MKLFGREAKIVKVKGFDEYAVEVRFYFFGLSYISYRAIKNNTCFLWRRLEAPFKSDCLGTYNEALKIYNEFYDYFEEEKQ